MREMKRDLKVYTLCKTLRQIRLLEKHKMVQVSISSTFLRTNFCTNVVSAAFTMYMQLEKAAETTFVQKICT